MDKDYGRGMFIPHEGDGEALGIPDMKEWPLTLADVIVDRAYSRMHSALLEPVTDDSAPIDDTLQRLNEIVDIALPACFSDLPTIES